MVETNTNLSSLERSVELLTRFIADLESDAFQQGGFSELSLRQILYLETIARLGHPSFSELADTLKITRPSVTALVGKLIRKGFVQKEQDGEDRRSFHIVLTEKGSHFTHMHHKTHQQVVHSLISHLDKRDIDHLEILLNKIVQKEGPTSPANQRKP
jgi:DNA-binding MarR family transcriptional regulator